MKTENELNVVELMKVRGGAGRGITCIFSAAVKCTSSAVGNDTAQK